MKNYVFLYVNLITTQNNKLLNINAVIYIICSCFCLFSFGILFSRLCLSTVEQITETYNVYNLTSIFLRYLVSHKTDRTGYKYILIKSIAKWFYTEGICEICLNSHVYKQILRTGILSIEQYCSLWCSFSVNKIQSVYKTIM